MSGDTASLPDLQHVYALSPEAQKLLFTEAHTTYKFTDEPVSDDQLRAIYELLKWAPTGSNVSPLRILFVRSPEGKQRLLPHLTPPNKPQSDSAPVVAVLARDTEYTEHVPMLYPIVPGLREAYDARPELRDDHGIFNATLQAAYFVLAVRSVGLDAGPMKGFNPQGIDEEFFPTGRWKSILVVNLGKAAEDGWRERDARLDFEQVVDFA
ncbi:malonic semialdehyde reductase [Kibdelosporangium aridum]|uniref:3-hydroxypropanoate dehydrogenase n=1 Tax=Kibdelosporangium aridum TaxID=2030 RepID=A0A1W2FKN0_KIBAR|nr:malonic semialdehyde reductase [Kibdelosporangium aridum]SMD22491.1 3-hydroxypropanoate dehydrogenase [Kibdelosporangium aridum]